MEMWEFETCPHGGGGVGGERHPENYGRHHEVKLQYIEYTDSRPSTVSPAVLAPRAFPLVWILVILKKTRECHL